MVRKIRNKTNDFSNLDVVVLAAYKLSAQYKYVDTEDIAIIADQIAPGRFAWKKYKDQINLEHVRVYLFDARKPEKGGYIEGNNNDGWVLTEDGVDHAAELDALSESIDLSRIVQTPEERRQEQWIRRERDRIAASSAMAQFKEKGASAISVRDAENLFKLDEYIRGDSRKRKIDRLIKAFKTDPELGPAVKALADKVMED
jgi:hypothetical protein